MKKSVKDYMREIENIYKEAAQTVAEDYDALTGLREERDSVVKSKLLTRQGKEKKLAEIDNKIRVLDADMYALRQNARNQAAGIRETVERVFYDYYNANAGDVDMQTMTLINSGVLTDSELMRMSETANTTMKRLIGRALENSKEGRFVVEGRRMQERTTNPHLRAVDGLIGIGDYACGGGRMSGASASKTYIARWDELTEPLFNSAPDVSWEMDGLKPGIKTYSEE